MSISDADNGAEEASQRQRVWDIPVRLIHWLLVLGIAVCWWTGTHNQLEYHLDSGYAVLWIALMRLYWGFFGSTTARFTQFIKGPKIVSAYIGTLHRRDAVHTFGHNPVGAISVIVMLALVLIVACLGLFAVDVDGLFSGPLSSYASFKTGRHIAYLHYHWFQYLLIAIGLHIAAIAFYLIYKRQNLISPMVTGHRPRSGPGFVHDMLWWRFNIGVVLVSVLVWLVSIGLSF